MSIYCLILLIQIFIAPVIAGSCRAKTDGNKVLILTSEATAVMKCSGNFTLFELQTTVCTDGKITNAPVCQESIMIIGDVHKIGTGIFYPNSPASSYTYNHSESHPDYSLEAFRAPDGRTFIIGDYDDYSQMHIYTPDKMSWELGVSAPEIRFLGSGELIDSQFYFCGGSSTFSWMPPVPFIKDCSVFDIEQNKWWKPEGQNLTQGRTTFCSFVLNGTLYLIGGEERGASVEYLDTKDPHSDWTTGAPFPLNITYCGASSIGDVGYVCGGSPVGLPGTPGFRIYNECYSFTKAENQWTQIASMHDTRYSFKLLTFDGKLYAILGSFNNTSGGMSSTIEWYDPAIADRWNVIEDMGALLGLRTMFTAA